MEELKKFVNEKPILVWCGLGALLFIFAAFCPEAKVTGSSIFGQSGSASCDGFKILSDLNGKGFAKFLLFLMLVAPLCLILMNFIKIPALESKKEKLPLIISSICFVLALLYMFAISGEVNMLFAKVELGAGAGTYLYLVFSAIGAAIAYLTNKK